MVKSYIEVLVVDLKRRMRTTNTREQMEGFCGWITNQISGLGRGNLPVQDMCRNREIRFSYWWSLLSYQRKMVLSYF